MERTKKITGKNVKVGMLFFEPDCVSPHNQTFEIVDIKRNPNAGRPCRDMWGGVVWAEPFGSIVAVGKLTGEKKEFAIQSEDSELSDWLTFINSDEERLEILYEKNRNTALKLVKDKLGEIEKALAPLSNYPLFLEDDEKIQSLTQYVSLILTEVI